MHCITIKDIIRCSVECHSSLILCVCVMFFHCGRLSLQHGLRYQATFVRKHLFMCCVHPHLASSLSNLDNVVLPLVWNLLWIIEIYTAFVCVYLACRLSSWRAHVSAGLKDSQFIGLWVRPIFLALSTHNSAFLFYSVQALRGYDSYVQYFLAERICVGVQLLNCWCKTES